MELVHGFRCACDQAGAMRLLAHPAVSRVEENSPVGLASMQVGRPRARQNASLTNLRAMEAIGATRAWALSQGDGVEVAIFDTGVDLAHPDLGPQVAGGINLVRPGAQPHDDHGHGTRVAGIIAAMGRTRLVSGVAPRARLYPVKVLDAHGDGRLSDVILGLRWVMERRIPLVNMSLDIREDSEALRTAIREAVAAGVTIVSSVGNVGSGSRVTYPAAYPEVIGVGAVSIDGQPVSFSNAGPEVDLVAPGLGVQTTALSRTYTWASGTSMASPFVAGVAALYLKLNPGATPEQVRYALKRTARPLEGLTPEQQGAGRVDALAAVRFSGGIPRPSPPSEVSVADEWVGGRATGPEAHHEGAAAEPLPIGAMEGAVSGSLSLADGSVESHEGGSAQP